MFHTNQYLSQTQSWFNLQSATIKRNFFLPLFPQYASLTSLQVVQVIKHLASVILKLAAHFLTSWFKTATQLVGSACVSQISITVWRGSSCFVIAHVKSENNHLLQLLLELSFHNALSHPFVRLSASRSVLFFVGLGLQNS